MKNERNIDFRATTRGAPTKHRLYSKCRYTQSVVEMNSRLVGVCNTPLQSNNIINMNGRIYDPVVGQFMQADNFIQSPEDYISYNRYAYWRHNPFKYPDPSGEGLVWFDSNLLTPALPYEWGADCYWEGTRYNMNTIFDASYESPLIFWSRNLGTSSGIGFSGSGTGVGDVYNGFQGVGQKVDGVYLVGNTPQELARSADGLSNIIHDRVIYDEGTGKIMGRLNLDYSDAYGFVNELRGWFDELITNSEKNGKRIDIRFAKTKSNFDRRTGTLTINSYYLKNNVGNIPYETRSSWNLFGQSYPIYEQVLCHELFGHGLDWVNNLAGGDCLFELNAITRENYMLASFGRPLRLNYPDCGGPLEDWMYYWDSKDSKTRR